jgi:UrcA family protein
MFRIFTTAAILVLTATAAQAGATATVLFGDLDLTRPGDMQVLAGRVRAAATFFCTDGGQDRHPVLLEYRSIQERCIASVSKTISTKVLAMSGQPRRFADK